MLPWWGWTLLWVLLLLVGSGIIAWRLRWLWQRSRHFLAALDEAAETLETVEVRSEEVRATGGSVGALEDPRRLRREYAAVRGAQREARRARRESRRPTWARPRRGTSSWLG